MDRQTFLETLNNRGVPKDQWKGQMASYRRFSGAFDDDKQQMLVEPPVAFKPNAILNYDPRKNLPKEELKLYNDFTTEEDEYKFIADQFLSSKYQKDISGVMTDIIIRQEMGLEKDEDVNYGAFVTKAKMSYTPESDEWMVSPEERFIMRNPDQEPAFKARRLTTQQKENQFINRQIQKKWASASSFAADYFGTSPIRKLMGVEQIKKDIRNDLVGRRKLNGEMVRGSATTAQSAQWGYYSVNFNQQYNALVNANRLEEADKLKAEYDELSDMVGSAFDYREKSWYERGLKEGVGTAVPMLETLLYGALTKDKKTLARVVNVGYWANQGAGQVKSDVVGNRKLTEINPNELSEINKISNILSIPYAVTEFAFAAIPSMSSIGSTFVKDTLAKATVKIFNNLGRGRTVARVGATTVINQFGERLEEGIQEFINTTSVELAKKADPEMESVRDTFKEFLKSDFKEAFAKGKEAFEESKYAVMFIGAGGTVVDLVQSNREYQSIQREREYLTQKKGFTDEKALELAIEKHGILGKDKQKTAMVQVKSMQLVDQGVEESEAKRISEALVNAKNKKETNAALFDFNKVILQSYVNRTRDQINPDLPNELLVDFDVEALAKMLTDSELETESASLAEELQTEVQTQIDNSLKNLRIKLVTETLANANMDRKKAREYATQLEEETDFEKNMEIRRKIAMDLSDLAAEYQMPNMPYSKLGLLTEEDFKQLRETMTDAELQELIDVPLYQLPKDMEELVDVFTRAVNGDKEAQAEYNQIMQDARDIDYDKFLKAFNLVDARFKPTQTVEERSEADSQPFSLSDEQREQILAGELAVNEVEEIANIRGISIEEARILLIDLIETYGQDFELDTETETEQEKIVRVEGINNIAVNVTKALAQVAPDVKIITHENTEQFEKATGQKSADGLFIGEVDGEKVIHINSEIARPETVAHEAFHALVNSLDISNIEERLFEISERVKPYLEKEALEELNLHLENYKNESYKGEESLAKMVEILSRNYQALPQTEKNIIIKFLERLIEMLGLSDYSDAIFNLGFKTRKGIPKRDKQVINFLNNLSVALSEGIEIQDRDLDVLRPDIETLSKKDLIARAKELGVPSYGTKAQILERVRGKFGKRVLRASKGIVRKSIFRKEDFKRLEPNPNVKITTNVNPETLDGKVVSTIMADRLAGGAYGEEKFFGGIYYPTITGYAWAASTEEAAQKIVDQLKLQEDENGNTADGFYYLTPIIMGEDAHLSNNSVLRAVVSHFETAIEQGELTLEKFQKEAIEAFDKESVRELLPAVEEAVQQETVEEAVFQVSLIVRELSFAKRKDFITTILGMGRNVKYPSIGDHPYFAKLLADPDLQKVARGEIVNVIKLSGLPKVVETDPNSDNYHDAYAYHLEAEKGDTIEVLMLEDTLDATQVIPEFEGTDEDGKPVKYNAEEYFNRIINQLGKSLLTYKGSQVQKKLIESSFAAELRITDPIRLPEFEKQEYERKPKIIEAALQLVRGEITPDQYAEIVMQEDPFEPYTELPDRIDTGIIKSAMRAAGRSKSFLDKIGINNANITGVGDVEIKDGDQISARLDIPTYKETGVFAVTLHEGKLNAKSTGRAMSYVPSIRLKNPVFKSQSHFTAYEIATGKKKTPISRIEGFYEEYTDEKNYKRAKEVLAIMQGKKKSKQKWIQVGFNPFRFGYFFDRETGQPVLSGSEAIQVGNVVFVKDPVYGDRSDPEFSIAKTSKEVEKALAAGIPDPQQVRFAKSREQIPEDVADIIKGLVSKIKEQPLMDSDILAERASTTSLTKADINKTREAYFIDGEAQNEVQHFESVVQRIQQSYTSDGANQLVKSNLSRLRTDKKVYMNPDHVFILALRKDELEREIMTVSREVEEAQANGATLTESNKLQELDNKLADLENLLTVAQSMTSQFARGLRFAQLSQTKLNIYALPRVLESARKQKGSELTKEERQDLTEYAKEIAKLNEEIDFINKTISEAEEQDLRKSSEEFISTTNKKFVNKAKRDKVKIIRERNEYLKIIKNMGFVVNEDSSTVRLSKVDQAEYTPEMRKAVADLARTFVEEGVTDLDDLISKIRTHLPEKSEYDIMNILSNRTPAKVKQVENANKTKLVELKKQARLRAEIKDLLDGVIKQKKLLKPDSAEVSKLKAQLKELRQEILNSDDVKADAIYDRIRRIEEGIEQAVSPRTNKKEESARLQQARQDLRELQRISKIDDQIKELQAQLKLSAKDLVETKKPKKEPKPIRNKELEQKIMERAALQAQLRDRIFNMQEKTFGYWYREIAGVPRALLATADMSYLLRQGLIVSAGHPILAAKSFGKAFQAFFSKGNARLFDENLRNMDLHPSRMYYGLELSTMDGALTEREESFATTLLQKIVGVREIVSASERHMVTGLNHLRTGLFDDFISKHPEASEEAKFAYARYVNVATGRGELGQFNGAAIALSQAFFSPRFAVSRIQAPAYAITNMVKQPELRGEMARQWLALAGTASAVLALAAANGADVGDDPEDSDFGKFVIGNRRYDIFGGLVQPIRLLMLMIKKNDSEYFQLIYDEKVKKDVRNEMFKFVEYKFNPILSLSHKLLFKEDPFTHKDIVWSEDWKEQAWSFAPIVAQSLKDSYDQEYNSIETASVFIPEFLGVGVGVYEKRSKTKKKPKTPKYY